MAVSGIQGMPLEATVVGCYNLKDKEWISRQDPYVCLEYGCTKFRTKTCTDGGRTPIFQEKYVIPLVEGLRELNVVVWNSNTLSADDYIGSARIQLHKVLSQGYDDTAWPLQSKTGKYSGEVRLILHSTTSALGKTTGMGQQAPYPPYGAPPPPYGAPSPYAAPTGAMAQLVPPSQHKGASYEYPPSNTAGFYPPTPYPQQPQPYPPPPAGYPTPHATPYHYPPAPAGSWTGVYPPPPY